MAQSLAVVLIVSAILVGLYTHLFHLHIRTIRWYNYYNDSQPFVSEVGSLGTREKNTGCFLPLDPEELAEVRGLLISVLRVLEKFDVRAALCHGTLWGVLRRGDLLPWDPIPDLCLLDVELTRVSSVAFHSNQGKDEHPALRALREAAFSVSDFDHWRGLYWLKYSSTDSQREMQINLRVFSDCTDFYYWAHKDEYDDAYPDYLPQPEPDRPRWACPHGWSFYVFYWASDGYQGFPRFLLERPLHSLSLGGSQVAVPNDDAEMQKYVYPNDWWRERSPPMCS